MLGWELKAQVSLKTVFLICRCFLTPLLRTCLTSSTQTLGVQQRPGLGHLLGEAETEGVGIGI